MDNVTSPSKGTHLIDSLQAAERLVSQYTHDLEAGERALDANRHIRSHLLTWPLFDSIQDYQARAGLAMEFAMEEWRKRMQSTWDLQPGDGADISGSQGDVRLALSGNNLFEYMPTRLVVSLRRSEATLTNAQLDQLALVPEDNYTIFRW